MSFAATGAVALNLHACTRAHDAQQLGKACRQSDNTVPVCASYEESPWSFSAELAVQGRWTVYLTACCP